MRSAFSTPRARFLAVCPALLLFASPAAARGKAREEQTGCMRIVSRDEAVALLARLQSTGLFSGIALSLDDGPTLNLELTENLRVRAVRLRGLSEFRSEDVLDRLLEIPSSWEVDRKSVV